MQQQLNVSIGAPRPATYAGRYEATQRIGEGNFGEVYVGRDHRQTRYVAIKTSEPSATEMLMREASVYDALSEYRGRDLVSSPPDGRSVYMDHSVSALSEMNHASGAPHVNLGFDYATGDPCSTHEDTDSPQREQSPTDPVQLDAQFHERTSFTESATALPCSADPDTRHVDERLVGVAQKLHSEVLIDQSGQRTGVLVMELLGSSIQEMFLYCNKSFSPKTIYMLADQCIARLEHLHRCGFIHRDIKPDNFLLGGTPETVHHVYLIDFGVTATVEDALLPSSGAVGTLRYASIRGSRGQSQTYYDDLEALAYMLAYLHRGQLTWQSSVRAPSNKDGNPLAGMVFASDDAPPPQEGTGAPEPEDAETVSRLKEQASVQAICEGLPALAEFLANVRNPGNRAKPALPAYGQLRAIFRRAVAELGTPLDWVYDWIVKREGEYETRSAGLHEISVVSDAHEAFEPFPNPGPVGDP